MWSQDSVALENTEQRVQQPLVEGIERKDIVQYFRHAILRKFLLVQHDVDKLARAVRIQQLPLIVHLPQIHERSRQPGDGRDVDARRVGPQQRDFRFLVWVVDGMAGEDVAHLGEKVIPLRACNEYISNSQSDPEFWF
jgi:hypothetical protein